jgi:Leucine-rich repeat (LRR) protein
LSNSNLNGATFTNASLGQASLQSLSAQIGPANVQFATFTNVNFANAQLASVDFSGGNLAGAIFDSTSLNGTTFANATMSGASFQGKATLQSVNFSAANLQAAKFNGVTIAAPGTGAGFGANFSCAQLGGSDFADATIAATNFGNAVMPAAGDCCPATDPGGTPWCGVIDATQRTYGPVTFPVLNVPVTCPDGSTGQCTDQQWRLSPNWQTSGCNKSALMQQMWSRPNCGGTPGEIVVFKDANLKKCILATLPGQTEVLLATAQQITQVNCPGAGVSDLTGLEAFTALSKLNLNGNQLAIFTLRFTSGGKPAPSNLQTLDISNNQVTTLDATGHPKLQSLSASNNRLESISLNANTYLVVLDASHNQLTSFNLPIQSTLAYVDLSYNNLAGLPNQLGTDLSALSSLSYLDLSHNSLTTIGSITNLAFNQKAGPGGSLRSLFLACNASFRCGDLAVYDGSKYPAASTSRCSVYNTSTSQWIPLATPACPPN